MLQHSSLTLSALRELVTSSWWILATSAREARRTGSLEEGMAVLGLSARMHLGSEAAAAAAVALELLRGEP